MIEESLLSAQIADSVLHQIKAERDYFYKLGIPTEGWLRSIRFMLNDDDGRTFSMLSNAGKKDCYIKMASKLMLMAEEIELKERENE